MLSCLKGRELWPTVAHSMAVLGGYCALLPLESLGVRAFHVHLYLHVSSHKDTMCF